MGERWRLAAGAGAGAGDWLSPAARVVRRVEWGTAHQHQGPHCLVTVFLYSFPWEIRFWATLASVSVQRMRPWVVGITSSSLARKGWKEVATRGGISFPCMGGQKWNEQ